jgi:hypothetical protein
LKSQPGGFLRVKHSARGRFDAPSSAVSLPSIALFSSNEETNSEPRPRRKSDHSPEKRRALKQVKSASGLLRRDRPNLERISGSDTGSSESSAENLHLETSKQKLKRSLASKSKDGSSSKKGLHKKETSKTETKSKVESMEIKSPSPPPSQVAIILIEFYL